MIKPMFIYELYDKHGKLLYIGITNNLVRRMAQHMRSKEWFSDALPPAIRLASDRAKALDIEKKLIRVKDPVYNKVRPVVKDWIIDGYHHRHPR